MPFRRRQIGRRNSRRIVRTASSSSSGNSYFGASEVSSSGEEEVNDYPAETPRVPTRIDDPMEPDDEDSNMSVSSSRDDDASSSSSESSIVSSNGWSDSSGRSESSEPEQGGGSSNDLNDLDAMVDSDTSLQDNDIDNNSEEEGDRFDDGGDETSNLNDSTSGRDLDARVESFTESQGNGLLLSSDDDDSAEDAQMSDNALSLSGPRPMYTSESESGTTPVSPLAASPRSPGGRNGGREVPRLVSLEGQQTHTSEHEGSWSSEDPSQGYNSRYEGTLEQLNEHDKQNDDDEELVAINESGSDDDDDNDDSSIEMPTGYLAKNGSKRNLVAGPDKFLKPNVGERPPTPPSPSKSPKTKVEWSAPYSPTKSSSPEQTSRPPHIPMDMFEESPSEEFAMNFSESEPRETSFEGDDDSFDQEQEQSVSDREHFDDSGDSLAVPYGNDPSSAQVQARPESHPEIEFGSITNSKQGDLTQDLTLDTLNKKRKRDRKLIVGLGIGLGCTVILLAAIIGAVIALQVSKNDASAPAPTPVTPAPAPPAGAGSATTTPTPSPNNATSPTARPLSVAIPPTDSPTQAPVTKVPTKAPVRAPTNAPVPAPTQPPTSRPTPADTYGSVKIPIL